MRQRFDHETPHWIPPDRTYFVTVCARDRARNTFCHPEIGTPIFESIRQRNEKKVWYCQLAVLMPDHIHLILDFPDEVPMTKALRDWKSYLGRTHGIAWQKNYFDHRLRNYEQFGLKAEYVFLNPERAGLVERAENWAYTWKVGP
jgi:putative transposase